MVIGSLLLSNARDAGLWQEPFPDIRKKDELCLKILRRANLDMFWSRETSTISQNLGRVKALKARWKDRYGVMPFPAIEPWVVGDGMGMKTVFAMLEKSLEKGKLTNYTQFDTCRQVRSTISNMYLATAGASEHGYTLKALQGKLFHLANNPLQSTLVERVVKGMKARMPVESARNLPLTGPVVRRVLEEIEFEWVTSNEDPHRKRLLAMAGGYIATTYSYSLRGNEGFWVDGDRLCEGIDVGKFASPIPHVLVPVLGFFKGENGERLHVFTLANNNKSCIRVRVWLERVVAILKSEGQSGGPAFCDHKGYMLHSDDVEGILHPILRKLQGSPGLEQSLPAGIDVELFYRCERSFRRGAENTALVRKVSNEAIAFVHRWSIYEGNRGRPPYFDMLRYYADGDSTRPLQLEFSSAV